MTCSRTAAGVALAGTLALAGCSGDGPEPACSRALTGGLTLAYGVHQNAPAAALAADPDVACLVGRAVRDGAPISVVPIDGTPQALLRNLVVPVDDSDPDRHERDLEAGTDAVLSAIAGATADSDGSDVTAALGIISDLAAASPAAHTTVVVYDSLLPDTGLVDMTDPAWALAEPVDVADHLTATSNLPDTTGTDWVLVGAGYTAAPQEPLPDAQRRRVSEVWLEVLRR
ncbi:MAG: hypothetical protein JHC71_19275, partial [Blastococcus sp.]|nr:hypothetical protein [Blastococcus sp.]